jgi:hypothetical protein
MRRQQSIMVSAAELQSSTSPHALRLERILARLEDEDREWLVDQLDPPSGADAERGAPMRNGAPHILTDYFTEEALAAELGVGLRTLRRWRALQRSPPYVVIGRQLYFRRDAVADWMRRRERDFDQESAGRARRAARR